eukprot:TRINITY_DN9062_c0_g1_i1.p1 TRINITY_DN9062_c0_g1~~TRINITY_DN9062_c0_g1_i1.p1  ORF type:complete len:635 (-),score=144.20 TRINITY_DN9062_c0_g1_i1:548-2452(-)
MSTSDNDQKPPMTESEWENLSTIVSTEHLTKLKSLPLKELIEQLKKIRSSINQSERTEDTDGVERIDMVLGPLVNRRRKERMEREKERDVEEDVVIFSESNNEDYPPNRDEYIMTDKVSKRILNAICSVNEQEIVISVIDVSKASEKISSLEQSIIDIMSIKNEHIIETYTSFIMKGKDLLLWVVQEPEPWKSHDLRTILKTAFPDGMPEKLIASIMKQVITALAAMHEKGVTWWNIRPRNILLRQNGTVVTNPMTLRTLTQATTKESLPFIAPELLRQDLFDSSNVLLSDVWSIGIVLYFLATGSLPFEDDVVPVLSRMIVEDPVPSVPGASEDLQDLLDLCLTRDANMRPTSEDILNHNFFSLAEGSEFIKECIFPNQSRDSSRSPSQREREIGFRSPSQSPVNLEFTTQPGPSSPAPSSVKIKIVPGNSVADEKNDERNVLVLYTPSSNTNYNGLNHPDRPTTPVVQSVDRPSNPSVIEKSSHHIERAPTPAGNPVITRDSFVSSKERKEKAENPTKENEVIVPVSNIPIETYCGETEDSYILYFRSIPGTTLHITVENSKTFVIRGKFPPFEIEEDVELLSPVKTKFKKVVNFAVDINPYEIEYERNPNASTVVIKVKKFAPRIIENILI